MQAMITQLRVITQDSVAAHSQEQQWPVWSVTTHGEASDCGFVCEKKKKEERRGEENMTPLRV